MKDSYPEDEEGFDLGRGWKRVLTTANLRRIAGDLSRGGWVAKEMPELRHIEVNPDRLSGRQPSGASLGRPRP